MADEDTDRGYPDLRAFPSPHKPGVQGLTLLEYAAVSAMQGIFAGGYQLANSEIDHKQVAEYAVKYADALCHALYEARHVVESDLPPPKDDPMVLGQRANR